MAVKGLKWQEWLYYTLVCLKTEPCKKCIIAQKTCNIMMTWPSWSSVAAHHSFTIRLWWISWLCFWPIIRAPRSWSYTKCSCNTPSKLLLLVLLPFGGRCVSQFPVGSSSPPVLKENLWRLVAQVSLRMSFLSPNYECWSTEGNKSTNPKDQWSALVLSSSTIKWKGRRSLSASCTVAVPSKLCG